MRCYQNFNNQLYPIRAAKSSVLQLIRSMNQYARLRMTILQLRKFSSAYQVANLSHNSLLCQSSQWIESRKISVQCTEIRGQRASQCCNSFKDGLQTFRKCRCKRLSLLIYWMIHALCKHLTRKCLLQRFPWASLVKQTMTKYENNILPSSIKAIILCKA